MAWADVTPPVTVHTDVTVPTTSYLDISVSLLLLIKEDGDYIITEDNNKILMEGGIHYLPTVWSNVP